MFSGGLLNRRLSPSPSRSNPRLLRASRNYPNQPRPRQPSLRPPRRQLHQNPPPPGSRRRQPPVRPGRRRSRPDEQASTAFSDHIGSNPRDRRGNASRRQPDTGLRLNKSRRSQSRRVGIHRQRQNVEGGGQPSRSSVPSSSPF